jgi:protein arginine kinase
VGSRLQELGELDRRGAMLLMERRLVSRDLLGENGAGAPRRDGGGHGGDQGLSVMVNEEDHLRLQTLHSGLDLHEAWNEVDALDEELGRELPMPTITSSAS